MSAAAARTALLIPFGLGSLFTLTPSMIAELCDLGELHTRDRREELERRRGKVQT